MRLSTDQPSTPQAREHFQANTRSVQTYNQELSTLSPVAIVEWALARFGRDCAIAFSGAEDVVLIDMAAQSGKEFSVFCLDTGRLHPETLEFVERVRSHYQVPIEVMSPERRALEEFVHQKGLFSFYEDGHSECCSLRKVEPLRRALSTRDAWITGQRRDQSPDTRGTLDTLELDAGFHGRGEALYKFNPLAKWTSDQVWHYIREHSVPCNPLHDHGFRSIGCAPCTRPVQPDQHERAGRWWWEASAKNECGLHITESVDSN